MDKYQYMEEIGRGSYNVVYKALNRHNGEIVAIKKPYQKYYLVDDFSFIKEIHSLVVLDNHPNIIKLKDAFNEDDFVYLGFEYMDCSLHDRIINQSLSESEIRNVCFQIFQALSYMHHKGLVHCDLKPTNILVSKNVVKISHFRFAREGQTQFTDHVTTHTYRAPELLLHDPYLSDNMYDTAVDIWATGAIMAELFTRSPLFSASSEADVMSKICKVLGTPTQSTWPGGLDLESKIKYRFPEHLGYQFSELLPNASSDAVNLIASLLSWDPSTRPTAMEALQHPFFDKCYHVPRALHHEPPIVTPSLIRAPILFKMAVERELLKKEMCLKSFKDDSERYEGLNEELVRKLPEHLFDYEIDQEVS